MNKFFFLILRLIMLSSFTSPVFATVMVTFPTGDAAWSIKFVPSSSAGEGASTQRHPSSIEVTQLNQTRRTRISWSDGTSTEQWALPSFPVSFEEDPRNGLVEPNIVGTQRENMVQFGIPNSISAFDWITLGTRQEKDPISYQGVLCYHYSGQVSPYVGAPAQKREAWIDAKTLLPVAIDTGYAVAAFTFSPKPPEGPLEMPAKFKKEINYYKAVTGNR